MTSGVEAEGSYVWNYTSVDPAVLPRNANYTLSYTITTNGVPIATEQAESTIKLTPEPAFSFSRSLLFSSALESSSPASPPFPFCSWLS